METLFLVILVILGLLVYFIPSIIAYKRQHSNSGPILALDIFLGWTFIGWVVCLVWALSDNTKKVR